MADNPFDQPLTRQRGVMPWQVREHVDWLNSLEWVKASGKPYRVRPMPDGRDTWERSA